MNRLANFFRGVSCEEIAVFGRKIASVCNAGEETAARVLRTSKYALLRRTFIVLRTRATGFDIRNDVLKHVWGDCVSERT